MNFLFGSILVKISFCVILKLVTVTRDEFYNIFQVSKSLAYGSFQLIIDICS